MFRENDEARLFYILMEGELKINKNIHLFLENPNIFYANRRKLMEEDREQNDKYNIKPYMKSKKKDGETLPFANFSSIYNYQPKNKLIELGILTGNCIFGEEEVFAEIPRQVSAQVSSTSAKLFEISPAMIEKILMETKNMDNLYPMNTFKSELYESISKKRILYRQQKLSEIL